MSLRVLLETHNYSDEQENALAIILATCSAFSFIGALFIMFNYFTFAEFKQNFAFKLIFCVAIGDLISSFSNFFGNPEEDKVVCTIQGILAEAGALTSIAWVSAISLSIWLIISAETSPLRDDTMRWLNQMHICIWSYVVICTLLPLTTDSYGAAGGWCWIKGKTKADNIWRFVLFYIPLWLCVLFMSFVYCRVWSKLHATAQFTTQAEPFLANQEEEEREESIVIEEEQQIQNNNNANERKDHSSKSQTLQRMKYYPLVLMICYTPATIRRLSELFTDDQIISPFPLAVAQVIFSSLVGVANAAVYGLSQKVVRDKDREWLQTHCDCVPCMKSETPHDVELGM